MNTDSRERQSELLNAYLDGELDPAETARLELRLRGDLPLRRHLLELRRVRELVGRSFPGEITAPPDPVTHRKSRGRIALQALAASVLLIIGIVLGLNWQAGETNDGLLVHLPKDAQTIQPSHLGLGTPSNEVRAIFHVASADPRKIRATLDHVEKLVNAYSGTSKRLRVELVANAEGLNMLRLGKSPAAERVAQIQKLHGNVKFLACGKTIRRVQMEKGERVRLLPNVAVANSALDQIILRLQEGWMYVRV